MPPLSPLLVDKPVSKQRHHLLDLDELDRLEIEEVLETATSMKEVLSREIKQVPTLRGKTIINMFFDEHTLTHTSFAMAAQSLSANVVTFPPSAGGKQEQLVDTFRVAQALGADMLVISHPQAGVPYLAVRHFEGAVINAGDGRHAHPSQALLDLFTIREKLGYVNKLKVVIVGDILHSPVARSNLWGLTRMEAHITLCAPPTLLGPAKFWQASWPNIAITTDLDAALAEADVVMVLPVSAESQQNGLLPSLREYSRSFGLTAERLAHVAEHGLIMHPGPVQAGVEIMPDVMSSMHAVLNDQVTNGVAVRMALLYWLASASSEQR